MTLLYIGLAILALAALVSILVPVIATLLARRRKRMRHRYDKYRIADLGVSFKEYQLASKDRRNFLVEQQRYRARSNVGVDSPSLREGTVSSPSEP